jgi:hypothetical protein
MIPGVDLDDAADDVEVAMDYGMGWLENQWYYHLLAGGAELALFFVGVFVFFAFGGIGVAGVIGIAAALVAAYSLLRRVLWVIGA